MSPTNLVWEEKFFWIINLKMRLAGLTLILTEEFLIGNHLWIESIAGDGDHRMFRGLFRQLS